MANFNVTPNMNLPNPVPGVDPGPDYADHIEASLNQIDQHNHSAGQGVLIQPNGINISSDLPFNAHNATALRSVRFLSQTSPIANTAPDVGILYVSGNELWYNDYSGGNQVQITTNGLINATASGISSGTATASFSAGILVVKSSATSFANIDVQSVVLANAGNLVNQLTLLAPTLSSSYDITLPLLPAVNSYMVINSSGVITTSIPVALGQQISTSCGVYTITSSVADVTNLTVSITTTGNPVMLFLQSAGTTGSGNDGLIQVNANFNGSLYFVRSGSTISEYSLAVSSSGTPLRLPCSAISYMDTPSAGSYVYKIQASDANSTGSTVNRTKLVAYELR